MLHLLSIVPELYELRERREIIYRTTLHVYRNGNVMNNGMDGLQNHLEGRLLRVVNAGKNELTVEAVPDCRDAAQLLQKWYGRITSGQLTFSSKDMDEAEEILAKAIPDFKPHYHQER